MSSKMALFIRYILVLLSLIAVLSSALVSHCLNDGTWFQRSGSLWVLFSVILEILQTKINQPRPSSGVTINGAPALTEPPTTILDRLFHGISWIGIVLGTLVWGYGDLVF